MAKLVAHFATEFPPVGRLLNAELLRCPAVGHLRGTLECGLRCVRTPFVFKSEHDIILLPPLPPVLLLLEDLQRDRVVYVRFNQRRNELARCDAAAANNTPVRAAARGAAPPQLNSHLVLQSATCCTWREPRGTPTWQCR